MTNVTSLFQDYKKHKSYHIYQSYTHFLVNFYNIFA